MFHSWKISSCLKVKADFFKGEVALNIHRPLTSPVKLPENSCLQTVQCVSSSITSWGPVWWVLVIGRETEGNGTQWQHSSRLDCTDSHQGWQRWYRETSKRAGNSLQGCPPLTPSFPSAEAQPALWLLSKAVPTHPIVSLGPVPSPHLWDPWARCWEWWARREMRAPALEMRSLDLGSERKSCQSLSHKRAKTFRCCLGFNVIKLKDPIFNFICWHPCSFSHLAF